VSQMIANFLQRQAFVDQPSCTGVTQSMGAVMLDGGSDGSQPSADHWPECPGRDGMKGSSYREEDLSMS
jgi:hypothetical protein